MGDRGAVWIRCFSEEIEEVHRVYKVTRNFTQIKNYYRDQTHCMGTEGSLTQRTREHQVLLGASGGRGVSC